MLEECADHLEKAVESLNLKVKALEDAENKEFVKASDSTRSSVAIKISDQKGMGTPTLSTEAGSHSNS